jgi:flavin-dependent dehydrogenase
MPDPEIIIIGGGPAGAAAAIELATTGRQVLVIERDAVTREKVCGEFLGPGGTAALAALGVSPASLGGVKLRQARLAHGRTSADIALPFDGWGVRRQRMDAALLDAAAAAGAIVSRGQAVRSAEFLQGRWQVRLADGAAVTAPIVVLATGKHELRGHRRASGAPALGLKLHVRLARELTSTVLLPAGRGYAGLQPTGEGLANLCMALHGRPPDDLIAHVASGSALAAWLLEGAVPAWPRPLAVAGVPYGFLHRDAAGAPPGLYRVGDQFAVVPSFCGEGMGMALAGGRAVARAIASGEAPAAFHARWRREVAGPMRWAGSVNWLLGRAPGLLTRAASLPGAGRLVARRTRAAR